MKTTRLGSSSHIARIVLAALALVVVARSPAHASTDVTFEAGSLIIPMDIDYQDEGMLRAFGLLDSLLTSGINVAWCIKPDKVVVDTAGGIFEADFTAATKDFVTNVAIRDAGNVDHAYRGGPFVIAASFASAAAPIVRAWQATIGDATAVHVATAPFTAPVRKIMSVSPRVALLSDGNQTIAEDYLNAAGILDIHGNAWSAATTDVLSTAAVAGTAASHTDGALFLASGQPLYCDVSAMHWTTQSADIPEVVQEFASYLKFPVHLNAECEAVSALESAAPYGGGANFLTTMEFQWPLPGAPAPGAPAAVQFGNSFLPFAQMDGPFGTVGGTEPWYRLATGSAYFASDLVMVRAAGLSVGSEDLWTTGYAGGACRIGDACPTGKVSYLGGHAYDTSLPISLNPKTQGTRLFLNSLYEAGCVDASGQPNLILTATAPATTNTDSVTFTISYRNSGIGPALAATITDQLPTGATFVSATGGGSAAAGIVTWSIGDVAAGGSGTVTVSVRLAAPGSYTNQGAANYITGANLVFATSNPTLTLYRAPTVFLDASAPSTTTTPATTFTLTYANSSASAITNAVLTDVLPTGSAFASASNGGVSAGGVVTWSLGTIAAGASASVTVTVSLGSVGSYLNGGTLTYVSGGNQSLTSNITTTNYSPSGLALVAGAPRFTVNPSVIFALTYTNTGNQSISGLTLTDALPPGAVYVTSSSGGTGANGAVSWTIGNLAPGASASVTATVMLAGPGSYDNAASASFSVAGVAQTATSNTTTTIYAALGVNLFADAPALTLIPTVTFTLTYANSDFSDATNVILSDALPAGATFVSASNGGTLANGTVTWNVGTVPAYSAVSVSVTLVLPSPGIYPNQGAGTYTIRGGNAALVSNTTKTIYQGPSLGLTASAPATTIVPRATFTIDYANTSAAAISNLVITDTLPVGASFSSATGNGIAAGGVVTWTIGNVAAGAHGTVAVTVTLAAPGSYDNLATAAFKQNNIAAAATSNTTHTTYLAPTLALSETAPATTPIPTLTYTITYVNSGAGTAEACVISDMLPGGAIFLSSTGNGAFANGIATWNIGDVAPGDMGMVTLTVSLPSPGMYTNQSSVTCSAGQTQLTSASNKVATSYLAPVVTVVKSAFATTTRSTLTYTLTYANTGMGTAQSVLLTDPLPAGTSYVSSTGNGVEAGGVVTWNVGDSAPGAMGSVTVTVDLSTPGTFANTAAVAWAAGMEMGSATSNTTSTEYRAPVAPLVLTASAPPTTLVPSVTFAIAWHNASASALANLVISDVLPAGAQFGAADNNGTFANGAVRWNLGAVAANASGTVSVTLTLPAPGTFMNSAGATFSSGGMAQSATSNVTTTSYLAPDVRIVASGPSATADGEVTISIVASNVGGGTAQSVSLTDALPANAQFELASNGGAFANGVVKWNLGDLLPSTAAVVTVTYRLPQPGTYTDGANGSFVAGNGITKAASNVVTTTFVPYGVSLVTSAPSTTSVPRVTWTIAYANTGQSAVTNFVFDDVLPAGATYVSSTGGGVDNNGTVTWTIGNLAAGATASVGVTVDLGAPGTFNNHAQGAFSVGAMPVTTTSNVTSTQYEPPGLSLTLSAPATVATASATYTIAYANTGATAANAVVIHDKLPPGTILVAASNGGTATGGVVDWAIGSVPAGDFGTVSMIVSLPSMATFADVATADFSSTGRSSQVQSNPVSTLYSALAAPSMDMAAAIDMTPPADLSTPLDMGVADDLSTRPDLVEPPDLSPVADLAKTAPNDLSIQAKRDLSVETEDGGDYGLLGGGVSCSMSGPRAPTSRLPLAAAALLVVALLVRRRRRPSAGVRS